MKRLLILAFASGLFAKTRSQVDNTHYWDNWYIGDGVELEFNGTALAAPVLNSLLVGTFEGIRISDPQSGQILFTTNSDGSIQDANGDITPNSALFAANPVAAVVPQPGNSDRYYLFRVGQSPGGVACDSIDLEVGVFELSLNGGLGDLDPGGWQLLEQSIVGNAYAVISDPSGWRHWLVLHDLENTDFLLYEVNASSGLNTVPSVQSVGPMAGLSGNHNNCSWMRVSPDNQRLAFVWGHAGSSYGHTDAFLFDVDPSTGIISNSRDLYFPDLELVEPEFSATSQVLYLANHWGDTPVDLVQLDLSSGDSASIMNSRVDLNDPITVSTAGYFHLRLGPDDRIYGSSGTPDFYRSHLLYVDQPDVLGTGCGMDTMALGWETWAAYHLPWNFWPYLPTEGLNEPSAEVHLPEINCLPQPVTGTALLSLDRSPSDGAATLLIRDQQGRIVQERIWPRYTGSLSVDVDLLAPGMYRTVVSDRNGIIAMGRLLKM